MAIQATSEEQLRMRRRARRRLLGAATLLLIAAIVLPMVLDQAPRPLDRDIEISIPSQTTAPLPAVAQMRQAPAQPAPAAPAAPVPAAPQPAELMPQSEPASAVTAPPAKTAEADKAKPEAAKPPVPPKAPQAEARPPTPSTEKPKPKPAAESRPIAAGHFVVQLGVFSRAENVQQLRAKLSAGGITTYTEALPNGTTRVHAGAFKLRPQAEQMQAKIAFLGVQARIVNLEP